MIVEKPHDGRAKHVGVNVDIVLPVLKTSKKELNESMSHPYKIMLARNMNY